MVSYIEVCNTNKPRITNNIGKGLKVPQRQFWKEALFVKYDKNKNVSLILDPIPIKSLPEGGGFFFSLIALIIEEGVCSDRAG